MERASPTLDEQDLALRIAERIDGAGYRFEHSGPGKKVRVTGLTNIILDEVMQFNRQKPDVESKQESLEW